VTRAVTGVTLPPEALDEVLAARHGLVKERPLGSGRFDAASGPFRRYRRTVVVERLATGQVHLTQTVEFELAIPYWGWLFVVPVRRMLGRVGSLPVAHPWWAPPDHLDARAATILGVLATAALVAGYLGTLITQTITFATDEFGASDTAQGVALASVRVGVLLALVLVSMADRRGRRRLLLVTAVAGCLAASTGALAPALAWLAVSQTIARAFSISLVIIIGIVAAEEMPAGARAYAVSLLGMAAALGAGFCVMALPLADLGTRAWRILYVLPLLGLPVVRALARHLPESKRFVVPHEDVRFTGHGRRLALLAVSAFLFYMFAAPGSQFLNEFLREERGYSAIGITLFTILTNTPGAIGIVIGGRLADVHGRRPIGVVATVAGTAATVAMFLSGGWMMWGWSLAHNVVGSARLPALGVYGPELFPTSLRGRANGVITVLAVAGSSTGLLVVGFLSDRLDTFGTPMAILAIGPVILAALVLFAYPETARLELEDINPEDRPPPQVGVA